MQRKIPYLAISTMAAAFALVAFGCSSAPDNPCTPGQVEPCPCLDGATGVQACTNDGVFGACQCPEPVTDTGGDDIVETPDAADTEVTDTSEPDTSEPDTSEPDTSEPDTEVTDTEVTDASDPDTGATDTGATDTGATDTGATDTGATDTGATDTGATDTSDPDTSDPDTGATDTSEPDTGATDTATDTSEPDSCTVSEECPIDAYCDSGTCVEGRALTGTPGYSICPVDDALVYFDGRGVGEYVIHCPSVLTDGGSSLCQEQTTPMTDLTSARCLDVLHAERAWTEFVCSSPLSATYRTEFDAELRRCTALTEICQGGECVTMEHPVDGF